DLEQPVRPQRARQAIGEARDGESAERESAHEGRENGGDCDRGRAEHELQLAHPQHLIGEAGCAGDEIENRRKSSRPARRGAKRQCAHADLPASASLISAENARRGIAQWNMKASTRESRMEASTPGTCFRLSKSENGPFSSR